MQHDEKGLVLAEADSFKAAQALYWAVTGKTEKLTRTFGNDHEITREALRQLHAKCDQVCTQWTVLLKSSDITLRHIDGSTDTFSSFDRFTVYDASRTAAVDVITYTFNTLLRLPSIEKPQNYKLTVRIVSAVALEKRLSNDAETHMIYPGMYGPGGITVEIEYVDYAIARNLMSMAESWVKEVEQQTTNWPALRAFFRKWGHWFPFCAQTAVGIAGAFALAAATRLALPDTALPTDAARWLILAVALIGVYTTTAWWVAEVVARLFHRLRPVTAIELNKGDTRLNKEHRKHSLANWAGITLGILFVLAQGVLANFLTTFLANWGKR